MKASPLIAACIFGMASLTGAGSAATQEADAPYDEKMMRLAEVLGSLHYLRSLCGEEDNPWRKEMQALLEAEKPDAARKARLAARFNHGYRSFWSVHVQCTDTAVAAIDRYMAEGARLSGEIIARYGN